MTQQSQRAQPDTGLVVLVQSRHLLSLGPVKQQESAVMAVLDQRLTATEQV